MADESGEGGKGLAKKWMGQPAWVWLTAGAVMVVAALYLYRKNSAAQGASSSDTAGTAAGPGATYGSIQGTLYDWQASPQPAAAAARPGPKHPRPPAVIVKGRFHFHNISLTAARSIAANNGTVYARGAGNTFRKIRHPRAGQQLYATTYELRHHRRAVQAA